MDIQIFTEKGTLVYFTESQKMGSGKYRYTISRSQLKGRAAVFILPLFV